MKNKVWLSSPVFFIFPVLLAVIAAIAWPNVLIFSISISGAVVSLVLIIVFAISLKVNISSVLKSASQFISGENLDAFEKFALPVVIIGEKNDIVWYNRTFYKTVSQKNECVGESILKYIYPKTTTQVITDGGVSVAYANRKYTVYGSKLEKGAVLYFVDDTYYKRIAREYNEKRPVATVISFDNREELTVGASSMNDAQIVSTLETLLVDWAKEMGGFIRRLSNNRYLVMTDEVHIIGAKEKKFDILDRVRKIKNNDGASATISIGIGRNASSLEESERWARQALDMALGRGGDQVAIKEKGDSYEFFGGLSKGVEKRDKVKTRVIAATLSDLIAESENVLIMGHKFSDLDSVGAAIGVWAATVNSLNKPAYIVVNKQQSLAKEMVNIMQASLPEKEIFISPFDAMGYAGKKSTVIVVDTHSPDMVESSDLLEKCGNVVVIDHHSMMVNHIKDAVIFYHEPYSSSASEMVAEIIQYISSRAISKVEANLLLAGIMLDTKGFVIKTGVRTFEAAAYLRRRGAETVEVKKMFADSFDVYLAKQKIMATAEIKDNCAIAATDEDLPELRVVAAQAADELLNIKNIRVSYVLYVAENGDVNISARSFGDVNVQIVMEKLGGGGHHSMAGAQLKDVSLEEAKEMLINAIEECK